jgi:release factor glutamine methyltransferase
MTTASADKATWTIESMVKWATDDFRTRGIENPRLDAEVLVAWALGIDRVRIIVDGKRPLVGEELGKLRDLVKRRRAREPVAYLRGEREFYGRRFMVDKRVLVPRPDTETLVDVALNRTAHRSLSLRGLDLCTGSGCVAITLARQRPTVHIHATDLSEDALTVARANAYRLGAYKVSFSAGDLFDATLPWPKFDLITANPPYIATAEVETLAPDIKDFEPRIALDGGQDGLDLVRRIVDAAPRYLLTEGVLALEIGSDEGPATAHLLEERGFREVVVTRDYGKLERVVSGVWHG